MNPESYYMFGAVVAAFLVLGQLAVTVKSLFGNRDFATRADLLRMEAKLDDLRRDTDKTISELNSQITSLTAAIASLETSLKSCFCRLCINFKPRQVCSDG